MKYKVLVVDDKLNTLKVICSILEDEGFLVLGAQGGEAALQAVEKNRNIDAILADLKMPGMSGMELFRALRPISPDIPFIVMTAHGTAESAAEALKEGVNNYLIKPLDYDELSLVLNKAINEKERSMRSLKTYEALEGEYNIDIKKR